MGRTYYEILGVAENATAEEIEAAFKVRAREVHPDTVAPGNAYLRQVAAEAFKDLSQAKMVLLDRTEREKYDAKLAYERGGRDRAASPGPKPSREAAWGSQASRTQQSSRAQQASSSQGPPPRRQAPRAPRPPLRISFKPFNASLESFAFVVMGVLAIFFVGWLMASGRTPPVVAVILTLALGVTSFRHGLKPLGNARVRGAMMPGLIGGFVVAAIFFSVWLPSTDFVVTQSIGGSEAATVGDAGAPGLGPGKAAARRVIGEKSHVVATEDSLGFVTRIWRNLEDGRKYRTRASADVLFLEAIEAASDPGANSAGGGKSGGEISDCKFHRAASGGASWTGVCREKSREDQSVRMASGELSRFSNEQLEGGTDDIAVFVMVPVEELGAGTAGAEGATDLEKTEKELSGLSDLEKQSIQAACESDKMMLGAEAYNNCVERELRARKKGPQ
jgi:DnaJ domain